MSELVPQNGSVPAPFEQLAQRSPDFVLYTSGPNRAAGPSLIRAQNDLQAVEAWLAEYTDSPATFRAYRKEVERFLNWIFLVHGIPLSSVMREHVSAYRQFLEDPTPAELWCAPRYTRRTDPAWRPFEGGLISESRDHAVAVLGSLFGFLRDMGYLNGSPVARQRRAKGRTKQLDERASRSVVASRTRQRYIPASLMGRVLETLTSLADAEPEGRRRRELERGLFVVRFMVNTGLRRAELASAKLGDVDTVEDAEGKRIQILYVLGKGAREREVVLTPAALEAVRRYHAQYGVSSMDAGAMPLLLSLSGQNIQSLAPLDESQIYRIIQDTFAWAAEALQRDGQTSPGDLARLCAATPHWMRRTYATLCLERGIALKHLQTQLGHRSASTTVGYQSSEITSRYAGLVSAQL